MFAGGESFKRQRRIGVIYNVPFLVPEKGVLIFMKNNFLFFIEYDFIHCK